MSWLRHVINEISSIDHIAAPAARRSGVIRGLDAGKANMGYDEVPFNPKNRTGMDGTLHRISAVMDEGRRVIGLTYRIGRDIEGG